MRAPTYTVPADAVSLVKISREIVEVSRSMADQLEQEGLVILVDDGTELSGTYVPIKGTKPAVIRNRIEESTHG